MEQAYTPVDLDRQEFEQARRDYEEHWPSVRDAECCFACDQPWPCPAHQHGETVLKRAGVVR